MKLRPDHRFRGDSGSALALVLIMIVLLSLWLSSVAVLTQSSQQAISNNVRLSERRANLVSGALTQAVQELTFDSSGNIRRWGVDWDSPGDTPSARRCSGITLSDYVSGPDTVRIQCYQKVDSGKTFPMASFVLTGTGEWTTPSGSQNCGTACVPGQDGGLNFSSSSLNSCTDVTLPRLVVSGGILNSSGVFKLGSRGDDPTNYCNVLSLGTETSTATVTMPDKNLAGCPATLRFGYSCTCPYTYPTSSATCTLVSAPEVSPSNDVSDIKAYLDSVSAALPEVSGTAAPTPGQSCATPDTTTYPGNSVVTWLPGRIDTTTLATLNSMTDGTCNATIILSPGVYRFVGTTAATGGIAKSGTNTWNITKTKVIVGTPKTTSGTIDGCNATAPGAQLQFANASYFSVNNGNSSNPSNVYLCSQEATTPVIVAPMYGAPSSFYWNGDHASEFLHTDQGNASGPNVVLETNGLVFAPAGWASLGMNGQSYTAFRSGAVFSAMTIAGTGSARSGGSVAPPPPFNGDRVVQFRFWDATLAQDLGLVQVVIRDYFGRRLSYAFRTLMWRTVW